MNPNQLNSIHVTEKYLLNSLHGVDAEIRGSCWYSNLSLKLICYHFLGKQEVSCKQGNLWPVGRKACLVVDDVCFTVSHEDGCYSLCLHIGLYRVRIIK
jgi:hypothetical protein